MATTLFPPPTETEVSPSDIEIIGGGPGQPAEPSGEWHGGEPHRDPRATPLTAYQALTFWGIVSIVMLFATITAILEGRWVDSQDWVSVTLPTVFYLNTFILLASSVTIEIARRSLRTQSSKQCARWMVVTLLLGLAFVVGQLYAWRELVARGLYLASNPGSFFIYAITGVHGLHVLGGIAFLAFVAVSVDRWTQHSKQKAAVGALAFYWHFMDVLWLYLFVLLLATVQR